MAYKRTASDALIGEESPLTKAGSGWLGSVSVVLGVRVVDDQAETPLSPRGELGKQRMMAITINTL